MHAPVLPVWSWDAIKAHQAELGLKEHSRPARVRVAVARVKRSWMAHVWPVLAAAALWLDLRIASLLKGATP